MKSLSPPPFWLLLSVSFCVLPAHSQDSSIKKPTLDIKKPALAEPRETEASHKAPWKGGSLFNADNPGQREISLTNALSFYSSHSQNNTSRTRAAQLMNSYRTLEHAQQSQESAGKKEAQNSGSADDIRRKAETQFVTEHKEEFTRMIEAAEAEGENTQITHQMRMFGADLYSRTGSEENPENYEDAISLIEPVLSADANNSRARTTRANAYLGLGRTQEAINDTNHVIEANKEDERAYMIRSLAYYQMKNYTQAMEDAKRTLAINPNNQTAYRIVKLASGRVTKAEELGLNAMQKAAADQIAREYNSMVQQRNQIESAHPSVDPKRMSAKTPKSKKERVLDSLNMQAQGKIRMGDHAAALALSNKVLAQSPENKTALYTRSVAANLMGQYAHAVEDASEALHHDPRHYQALDARSLALINLGRFREALVDADTSISINAESAYAYKNRAMAKEGLGDLAGMIEDYKTAARLSPQFEGDLQEVAEKYDMQLDPALLKKITPVQPSATAPAQGSHRRRFLVVLISSVTGGLLIAFGLLHIILGARKEKRIRTAGAGLETQNALGSPGLEAGYNILREVGHGGMGIVYEAIDKALDRKVAIKKMRDEIHDDPQEQKRFLEEARIVAALHHTNIIDIHNILEDEGDLYMIFEYVEGSTLDEILAKKRKLSISEAQFIVHGVTSALTYAHAKGVIHRDLKPANIMITKEGVVKVMDFGIARQAQDAMAASTKTNTVAGTPHYMAPEQEEGIVRKESDIFALGACLYEMLTGERPYPAPATTASKLHKRYEKPSRISGNLPPELDALIDDALEPDPDNRISTASDFRKRLDSIHSVDEQLG